MLVNKSFPDLITPPLILHPPLLDNLLNLDHYRSFLDSLALLRSISEPHQLSLRHVDANGEGNSLKKNSLKTCSKELKKTRSSSRPLTLEFESRIQQSSEGVMLRFFSFLTYMIHVLNTYAVLPLHCFTYICAAAPFPFLHVLSLSAAFSYSSYLHAAYPSYMFHY